MPFQLVQYWELYRNYTAYVGDVLFYFVLFSCLFSLRRGHQIRAAFTRKGCGTSVDSKGCVFPGLHTSHRLSLHLPGVSRLENNKLSRCIFSFPLSLSLTSSVTTSFWNVLKAVDRNTRSVCLPLVGVAGLGTEAESRTELTRLTSVWGWQWECIWNLPGQAWELKQISTQVPHLPRLPPSTSYFPPPPAA